MKKIILTLLLLPLLAFAQAPTIQWQKTLGGTGNEEALNIQETTDGGYIVVGFTNSNDDDVTGNHGNEDYWVVKLNNTGTIQWQKTLGGTGNDYANNIQQTSDGGYIVAGSAYSNNGDVTGNHGNYDYWIVKLFNTGTIQWQKTFGGIGDDRANSIQQTTDGGYIVAGQTTSNDGDVTVRQGNFDYWIVKLSNAGTMEWQKTFGGINADYGQSIQQTADGGYIVAGLTDSNNGDVTGNHGSEDYWIVKLDSTGTVAWQKTLGGTINDNGQNIQQTTDGGYIVAGYVTSNDCDVTGNHGNRDYWVVKLNSIGTIEWQKTLGGTGGDEAYRIQQTNDGGFIVAGKTFSNDGDVTGNHGSYDCWVVKLNSSGTILWQKTLGGTGDDVAFSIQQTIDGGYIVAGYTASNNGNVSGNNGNWDYWIVKLVPDPLSNASFSTSPIKIFPNPTASFLTIQGNTNLLFDKIIVTDLVGKIVLMQEQNTNQINVEKLSNGMYLLQVLSGEEKFTSKFIKE